MNYESQDSIPSKVVAGVVFTVNRMSFGRRLELMRRVKAIAPRLECFQAGDTGQDKMEASLLSAEIDQLYLEWGLTAVSGLDIDGTPANAGNLISSGPEDLCVEALRLVKQACRLSESEIKN
jgi:hypothetical protein